MRARWLGRSALLGVLLTAPLSVAFAAEPQVFLNKVGRLVISGLPQLLTETDVQRHLESGLTTSFVFQARPQRPMKPGAARVDIRFELWDEVYLVTVIDGGGGVEKLTHDSPEALRLWWSNTEIVLSDNTTPLAGIGAPGLPAKVTLAVVPFSQAELVDTQKWLTESISRNQTGAGSGRAEGASRAVGALIATSMQRRAVRSMSWNLLISRRDEP